MGFSLMAGFAGGAARAGEQVLDQNIARLDAAGVARAREEAQARLEQRIEQATIRQEGRTNKRQDFTRAQGLMDDKTKIADALKAKITEETRTQSEDYINASVGAKNKATALDTEKQAQLADKKSESEARTITAQSHADKVRVDDEHYKRADANEAFKNGKEAGGKPLSEPEIAARVHAGVGTIDYVFGKGLDIAGRALNPNAIDNDPLYMATKAKYEDAVRKGELPLSASSRLVLEAIGGDKEKKKALEDYEAKQKAIKDRHWWQSSDEKPATPKAESKTVTLPPIATRKDGDTIEIGGVKRSWNSKANDGKGGWGMAQENPQAPKVTGLMPQAKADTPSNTSNGMIEKGNINLNNRPVVKNSDGSISTVRSMGVNIDGTEVLIPTVVNGKVVSNDEAIAHYKKTGEHLGKFKSPKDSDVYAQQLHEDQDKLYSKAPDARGLLDRAAAAKQRMNDLAKSTGFTSREERDAARKQKPSSQKPESAPGGTPIENPVINTLPKMGLSEQGKRDEAEFQSLGNNKNLSEQQYWNKIEQLLQNAEFRNNHPEVVKVFKESQDELAAFNERQNKKGSR